MGLEMNRAHSCPPERGFEKGPWQNMIMWKNSVVQAPALEQVLLMITVQIVPSVFPLFL